MEHHFFAYINRMKFIQRWGLMRNTMPENDMEHALQTAMIAHAIALMGNARYERTYDAEHIAVLGMYHDASEVITGDLPTPIKHHNPAIKQEYNKLEDIAANKLIGMIEHPKAAVIDRVVVPGHLLKGSSVGECPEKGISAAEER